MKKLLAISFSLLLLMGCTFSIKIEGNKQPAVVQAVKFEKAEPVAAVKNKSNYQRLKDEIIQKEWLNLPHDAQDSRYFATDSNYNPAVKKWDRIVYYQNQ